MILPQFYSGTAALEHLNCYSYMSWAYMYSEVIYKSVSRAHCASCRKNNTWFTLYVKTLDLIIMVAPFCIIVWYKQIFLFDCRLLEKLLRLGSRFIIFMSFKLATWRRDVKYSKSWQRKCSNTNTTQKALQEANLRKLTKHAQFRSLMQLMNPCPQRCTISMLLICLQPWWTT